MDHSPSESGAYAVATDKRPGTSALTRLLVVWVSTAADLALLVPDALEFLGTADDDNGGGPLALLGPVDAAEDFDAGFLSELLSHEQSDSSNGSTRKESECLGSTDMGISATSGPDGSALVNASVGRKQTKKDTARDRRLRRRAVSARLFRERKKVRP